MWQEGDTGAFLRRRGLGDLTGGPKRNAHARKVSRKPRRFRQVRIGFVEADQGRFHSAIDLIKVSRARVEAKPERRQAFGDDIAILGTSQAHSDIRLAPLETGRAETGRDVDNKAGLLPRQPCKPRHEKSLRQAGRRVDANEPARAIIRAAAPHGCGCGFHIGCGNQRPRSGGGQDVTIGPPFDEPFAKSGLQRLNTARYRCVIDKQGARCGGQAAVPCQGGEDADVLPIQPCAFLISH
jgi:hypothetical protein